MRCDELASRVSSFDLRVSYCFPFQEIGGTVVQSSVQRVEVRYVFKEVSREGPDS
jgi:hypothetical protein